MLQKMIAQGSPKQRRQMEIEAAIMLASSFTAKPSNASEEALGPSSVASERSLHSAEENSKDSDNVLNLGAGHIPIPKQLHRQSNDNCPTTVRITQSSIYFFLTSTPPN